MGVLCCRCTNISSVANESELGALDLERAAYDQASCSYIVKALFATCKRDHNVA